MRWKINNQTNMKTTKKTVRGWVLYDYEHNFLKDEDVCFPIYRRKKDAEQTKSVYRLRHYMVLPVTITYEIPVKKK